MGNRILKVLINILLIILIDLASIYIILSLINRRYYFFQNVLPNIKYPILILGAGISDNKKPSQLLTNRLNTGLLLFKNGKAKWLLISGDNHKSNYNEPKVMKRWLTYHNIPKRLLISDFAGYRTYNSLLRAKQIFNVNKLIIVTSDFHLYRAIFLSNNIGLETYGITTIHKCNLRLLIREYIAWHLAILDIYFHPKNIILGKHELTPKP